MSKKSGKIIPIDGGPLNKGSPIYNAAADLNKTKQRRPSISITYLDVGRDYGLKGLVENDKRHRGERYILKEFDMFLEKVRKYDTIEDVMRVFAPRKKMKNADTESGRKMREIEKKYNIETANMVHIHCCGGGGGQMVLHGFVLHNCFEIVWIDTDHDKHKV